MWFGTILYVHIILKPAYAARGLPRGELRIGQAGVLLVATTGTLLALHRVHSWHALFNTRFGVLLTVKIALFLVMATTAIVVTVLIRPRLGVRRDGGPRADGAELTLDALSSFDGQEERPSFVAYEGKVFDLSRSHTWRGGLHMKRHRAGADLTEALAQAPHGPDRLTAFPEVGRLVVVKTARSLPERVFHFMAYMNLGVVAAVLLVIALWRS
jgi:predicted heme/steroid binding protein